MRFHWVTLPWGQGLRAVHMKKLSEVWFALMQFFHILFNFKLLLLVIVVPIYDID